MDTITIVIPAYNEGKAIRDNMETLLARMQADGIPACLMLVDDGSRDNTWDQLVELSQRHSEVRAVRLSRNFGKEAAIMAGVAQVQTELCLVMDADLQHPPELIAQMVRTMEETGADIVEGVKTHRGRETLMYKLFAKSFYRLMGLMSGMELGDSSDFKLFNRKVMNTLARYGEQEVFFRGLMDWSGFERVQIPFAVAERQGGESKFTMRKLMALSINSVLSFTSKPLYLTAVVGVLFLVGSVVLAAQTLVRYFMGRSIDGFTTLILLNLIIGGLTLLCLGIIGLYIGRIYNQVKDRPQYIISQYTGCDEEET